MAATVFGSRLDVAEAYVALLADTGISHGLIGPREAPRLWDRHVLNSAVVQPVFAQDARVADIGSGAGLPGIPLAIARPDLHLVLVEPLLRRTIWLTSTIEQLGLTNVEVHRGRAESLWGVERFRHVTARAVARTGELARITLPLLSAGGSVQALKGESAQTELDEDASLLRSLGASRWRVSRFGAGIVDPETVVLTIEVDALVGVPAAPRGGPRPAAAPGARTSPRRSGTGSGSPKRRAPGGQ
ncbi:MAG TPA: 16S rRNA (guanine(527)-N(7))-methyltransferase RsmG [Lapillicoccus sp.]|uniref:16S rRNA (guanine(527)-N(7))-methyltransferase RsmG n=1 Tax=Lapillicoccus sp. TaxID=1909287 RepID=UPI002F926C0F